MLNQPTDFVDFLMNDYLTKNGFLRVTRKGEQEWNFLLYTSRCV